MAGSVAAPSTERLESAVENDIARLQNLLHDAYAQLEQANTDCVKQAEEVEILVSNKEEGAVKMRDLERKNAAIKRRLAILMGGRNKFPKPGPKLRAFEDLSQKQQKVASKDLQAEVLKTSEERRIHPTKLSAYLTYR